MHFLYNSYLIFSLTIQEGHERRMPQLQNARCYSTDEQEHEQRTGEGDGELSISKCYCIVKFCAVHRMLNQK